MSDLKNLRRGDYWIGHGQSHHWWDNALTVHEFARILIEVEYLDSAAATADYFERPWRWDPEYEIWAQNFRPWPDDALDTDVYAKECQSHWDKFKAAMDERA